jgi:hypothetical protein
VAKTCFRLAIALVFAGLTSGFAESVFAQAPVPIPRIAPRGTLGTEAAPGTLPAGGNVVAKSTDAGGDNASGGDDSGGYIDNPTDINAPPDVAAPDAATPNGVPAAPDAGLIDLSSPADALPPGTPQTPTSFELTARLTATGPPITYGMTWRVFSSSLGRDGKLKLEVEAHGGSVNLTLVPGVYLVHAAYGHAGTTRKIVVGGPTNSDSVVLNAGGLRLSALVGKDTPLAATDVNFDIYPPSDQGSEQPAPIVSHAPAGHVIGLEVGVYHVVCRYGDANAVVRADIRVEAGKLTDATVSQKAARLTLKLVTAHGGEAIANTVWSVVTPSGDNVAGRVGAFPSVVLAVGDYTAIAKHDGKIFEGNFAVEAGLNRDVEVIATP